jgi:type I restriction enzyme R subunit
MSTIPPSTLYKYRDDSIMSLNDAIVEDAALEWFGELAYAFGHGPYLAPCEPAAGRNSFGEVVLVGRLRAAIRRLNPALI